MPASSWSASSRRSGPGPAPAQAGSRRRPTSTFLVACSPSSRTVGDGTASADVPDVGMTVQAMANGKPELARKAAEDVATFAWRRREALLKTATVHPIPRGVKLAREAVARGAWPVVLADHSDRSGSATWVLQQVIAQDLGDVLFATIADRAAVEAVR